MDKYGYILNQRKTEKKEVKRFHRADLELMTAFQLREICRKEKIIQGILNPMDQEELIRVILRFRGADEYFLIDSANDNGWKALENVIQGTRFKEHYAQHLQCSSKIVAYEGLAIGFYDGLTLPYEKHLEGTNALVAGGDRRVCTILNIVAKGSSKECLYLTKPAEIPCRESAIKSYSLYCMGKRESEMLYRIYNGDYEYLPEYMEVYRLPILDFEVRNPIPLSMPVAIDFGTSNTAAGVYLDNLYFEKAGLHDGEKGLKANAANYALFYDTALDWQETTLLPSVVGVHSVEPDQAKYLFGYDAVRLAKSSYIDEGFCVFYDIKRWIGDYEKKEEITDRQGRRKFVSRKDILKAYFDYVMKEVRDQFKCNIKEIHISCPVKQKAHFQRMFTKILPEYSLEKMNMLDEGVSVLYNTISDLIQKGNTQDGKEYKALVIDCGGGTTDLCSLSFRIWDRRVSYEVEIHTSYENGYTDFGGNNLTYRIMQILKISIVNHLFGDDNSIDSAAKNPIQEKIPTAEDILAGYDIDVFRYVDAHGIKELYKELEEAYEKAESFLPTRFQEFENRSRADYFKVKNNFYFLFELAESVKKEFYNHVGILRVILSSRSADRDDAAWILADKWKLSVCINGKLKTLKELPDLSYSISDIERLLTGDIYGLIRRFVEKMYEDDVLEDYSIIKLTGQSCKIGIFREALKEFVPGKIIQFQRRREDMTKDFELKMVCVAGALSYLKDRKYGFANVEIHTEEPALPYQITAFTHSGDEVILIQQMKRSHVSGMISRNMEDLTLKLYLEDMEGNERYQYTCYSTLTDFAQVEYEAIRERYGEHIRQADTDDIVENEVKFFVWARPDDWAFLVVPVYRKEKSLYLGQEKEFFFENDGWVRSFFDGTR